MGAASTGRGEGRNRGGRRGPGRVRRPGHGRPGRWRPARPARGAPVPEHAGPGAGHAALGHPRAVPRDARRPGRGGPLVRAGQRGHRLVGRGLRPARRGRGAARQPGALPGQPDRRRGGRRAGQGPGGGPVRGHRDPADADQHDLPAGRGGADAAAGRGPDPAADPRPARLLADRGDRRRGDQRVHHPAVRHPGPGLGLGPDRPGRPARRAVPGAAPAGQRDRDPAAGGRRGARASPGWARAGRAGRCR